MPKRAEIRKVLVVGSGPIIIGQAAEFDYAGTQACLALKEEGIQVVLANSNPATIMTDTNVADRVYIEPLTPDFITRIIQQERPDGILPTLGGQVGLNIVVDLAETGVLREYGVRSLGTPIESIAKAEDRKLFKATMQELGEPVPASRVVTRVEDALEFAAEAGFPVIVRPAYTLGGTGGGVAGGPRELREIVSRGLRFSRIGQALIEQSLLGWKEIEYEVMRDSEDNCITVCNMENLDAVGIHTGDSIVVAPSQTLTDLEYQMLRSASLRIIRGLGIEGGCNVQYALHPRSMEYQVIEVNPRVSRSSALASKATGYPIARVAAKIAAGLTLPEIPNAVTGKTCACFEPALDYVVLKIPRWPFDKFAAADRRLGSQMKSTGEVMSIGRTFEAAMLKAVRSLETDVHGLLLPGHPEIPAETLRARLTDADDERLFLLAEALRRGWSVEEIHSLTAVDPWFLRAIGRVVAAEADLSRLTWAEVDGEVLTRAKAMGFPDRSLSGFWGVGEAEVRAKRRELGIVPSYRMVDTCAGEFEARTPYFYSAYGEDDEAREDAIREDGAGEYGTAEVDPEKKPKVIVLGSGPIRIGQGIEFDYCSVHSVWAAREEGYRSIIINNNPETVSTDFNTSDRLYFEPLFPEDVLEIIKREHPHGVIVQFGGQTAINLASILTAEGIPILGTTAEGIDLAEDREKFQSLLLGLGIPQPPGRCVTSTREVEAAAEALGFPLLVRPSYVLGGRAMEIIYNQEELQAYIGAAVKVSRDHPVLLDRYFMGREVEVDAVCDGKEVLIAGVMEHVERAGVHSGDSIAVYPSEHLSPEVKECIVRMTTEIALAMKTVGLINIQFVVYEGKVYLLEVNPRSSRTVPFLTKVTGVPLVTLGTRVMLGRTLADLGYSGGLHPEPEFSAVKMPVFSFSKLLEVDASLGPEMKSTGEVMGVDFEFSRALHKAFLAAGFSFSAGGSIIATIADKDKDEAIPILRGLSALGYKVFATRGTAAALRQNGVTVTEVKKIGEGSPNLVDMIRDGDVAAVVSTITRGKMPQRDGFRIRRAATELGIPCLTSLDTARAVLQVLRAREFHLLPLGEKVG